MRKPVMIVENNKNPLSANREESGKDKYIIGGTFTEFDVKNRNERIYTADRFLPCLEEMRQRISEMGVYGEFDHPDVFDTSLSKASHIIQEANYNQEANRVEGKIKLLGTYWGKEARALVDDDCPIFVSSRAAGITENDGSVTLKKLFTYDIVADPGFSSARMSSINESLNYSNNSNFRIYEMNDESKINELFNMNKNEFVTKKQLDDYSNYLNKEIAETRKSVNEALKTGELDPTKLDQLLEYYETLNETNQKMIKYLDYLADKIQVVAKDNADLKEVSEKLITHSDYLTENLENTNKNLESTIEYTEYLAENLDRTIAYGEYIAENLDNVIAYGEYIAENLDNAIEYSEYLAEHVEGNIAYSEYIAEHLDDNIAYSEYIAENLDRTISYSGVISEKISSNMINEENSEDKVPTLSEFGFEVVEDETTEETETTEVVEENLETEETVTENVEETTEDVTEETETVTENVEETTEETTEEVTEETETEEIENISTQTDETVTENVDETTEEVTEETETEEIENISTENVEETTEEVVDETVTENVDETTEDVTEETETETETVEETTEETETTEEVVEETNVYNGDSDTELSKSIDDLISEAKKRKISETNNLHFLKFLNKSQVDSYYQLTNEEQELVKVHINEKSYFNTGDVLRLIQEALSVKNETSDEKLIRLIPEDIKPLWENLNDFAKKSILSQSKLGYDLTNEAAIENFWYTRKFNEQKSTKKLVSHDSLIQEDKLSDDDFNSIMERFNKLD